MANYRNDFADVNLETGTICRNFMNHSIGSGDALGDRFGVRVFRNGEPVSLGGTVAGYFVRNTTGETVVISSGVVSGNEAYVTLPAACYAVEGSFTLAIKVTSGSETVTMRIVDGVVSRTNTSVTVDPGTLVPSIETLISAINSAVGQIPVNYNASFAPAYSASSTYAVGDYVVYDGYLWRCTTAITETESWTAAHWTKVALANDVSDLKSALGLTTGNEMISFTNGKYINTNVNEGSTVDLTPQTPTSSVSRNNYAIINVSPGDMFTINGSGGNAGRLWAFVDSSTKLISKSASNATGTNLLLTAPVNASKLVLNVLDDASKCFVGELIDERVKENNEEIASIKNNIVLESVGYFRKQYTKTTSYDDGAERFPYVIETEQNKKYKVKIIVNNIPTTGTNPNRIDISAKQTHAYTSGGESITGDLDGVSANDSFVFDFIPSATRGYIQLYIRSEAGSVDIAVGVEEIVDKRTEESAHYKRIAYLKKTNEDSQRMMFPFVMKTGNQYRFRVFANIINAQANQGNVNFGVISADTLTGSADAFDIHDNILKYSGYTLSDADKTAKFNKWVKYNYTAIHDTDYIELYTRYCDIGSEIIVEVEDNNFSLADYVYQNNFAIRNHGNRMIYDTKNYPFKRIGAYSGSGQGIVERYGDIFVFTNSKMYRYRDLNVISTSSLFEHPINASLMLNGNIMISDITDYNTENEVRHVYEYNPDTDTIVNDYVATVTGKHLVLSEEIDSSTILVAFKNDNETERIIFWYSYDIETGTVTYISETPHDRIYTQGCSLRGNIVYVMTNNITTSESYPAKLLVVKLTTGEILNEIVLSGFGETEGFFVTYSETPGTYAFMLDNGDRYIYLIKLV